MNKFETQKEIFISVMSSLEWNVSEIHVELDKEKVDSGRVVKLLRRVLDEMKQGVNYAFHEGCLFQLEEKKEKEEVLDREKLRKKNLGGPRIELGGGE